MSNISFRFVLEDEQLTKLTDLIEEMANLRLAILDLRRELLERDRDD